MVVILQKKLVRKGYKVYGIAVKHTTGIQNCD